MTNFEKYLKDENIKCTCGAYDFNATHSTNCAIEIAKKYFDKCNNINSIYENNSKEEEYSMYY